MIHPDTVLSLSKKSIGYGIFATDIIPRGTITWVFGLLDFKFNNSEMERLPAVQYNFIERHAFVDNQGCYILGWDIDKYCNHSCRPSTAPIGSICDIALRDIQKGEEITCDYATCNIQKNLICQCGVEGCRGIVKSSDLISLCKDIDNDVTDVISVINKIDQPLLQFMDEDHLNRLQSIISGNAPIPSCIENAYHDFMGLACTYPDGDNQCESAAVSPESRLLGGNPYAAS